MKWPLMALVGALWITLTALDSSPAAAQTPLSAAEFARLQNVTAWDIQVTRSVTSNVSGGGGVDLTCCNSNITNFFISEQKNFVYSVQLTVAGNCTSPIFGPFPPFPCKPSLSPQHPGVLTVDANKVHRRNDITHSEGLPACPEDKNSFLQDDFTMESFSMTLDGTPGFRVGGGFFIDISENPPLALSDLFSLATLPAARLVRQRHAPCNIEDGLDLLIPGLSPNGDPRFDFGPFSSELTDAVVQVENGRFVIRGQATVTELHGVCLSVPDPTGFMICDKTSVLGPKTTQVEVLIQAVSESTLQLIAGTGTGPNDPSTQHTDVVAVETTATLPLGSRFFIQLDDAGPTPVPSTFSLGASHLNPPIAQPTLFPNNVVLGFDLAHAGAIKFFQAVHLGDTLLTIRPTDQSLQPVQVRIRVVDPAALGAAHNDLDASLVAFAHSRGIPPHFLKGQARQESGPGFNLTAYRYEPLSADLGYISHGQNLRTHTPYSLYRLATTDGLPQGTDILDPEDIAPRAIYSITRIECGFGFFGLGCLQVRRHIVPTDQFVSALEIYENNDATHNWSAVSPARALAVAANANLLNFTAQTPLAASYGLLQIMYATAIAPMQWAGVGAHQNRNPSFLFDTAENRAAGGGSLELGSGYLRRIFDRANPTVVLANPVFASSADFDAAFERAFNFYNHGGTAGDYGASALNFARGFVPVPATPIFSSP